MTSIRLYCFYRDMAFLVSFKHLRIAALCFISITPILGNYLDLWWVTAWSKNNVGMFTLILCIAIISMVDVVLGILLLGLVISLSIQRRVQVAIGNE